MCAKWRPFCLSLNVLKHSTNYVPYVRFPSLRWNSDFGEIFVRTSDVASVLNVVKIIITVKS